MQNPQKMLTGRWSLPLLRRWSGQILVISLLGAGMAGCGVKGPLAQPDLVPAQQAHLFRSAKP